MPVRFRVCAPITCSALSLARADPGGRRSFREPMKHGCRDRDTKWSSPSDEGANRFLGAIHLLWKTTK